MRVVEATYHSFEGEVFHGTITYNDEGQQHGLSKWYYDNGTLREELNYRNDKMCGLRKVYYTDGNLYMIYYIT